MEKILNFCFVLFYSSERDNFTHILQVCSTGTGVIVWKWPGIIWVHKTYLSAKDGNIMRTKQNDSMETNLMRYTVKNMTGYSSIIDPTNLLSMVHQDSQYRRVYVDKEHFNGLVQDCSISSALAMEILQSCTTALIYIFNIWTSFL